MPDTSTTPPAPEERAVRGFTRWNAADTTVGPRDQIVSGRAEPVTAPPSLEVAAASLARTGREARVVELPVATTFGRAAYIAGTFDTKGRELGFLRNCLEKLGLRTVTVDLATSGAPSPASVPPREVARHHPGGERAVFTGDRGSAVTADGHRLRALRHDAARPRRHHLRRRLGRHGARHAGDARAPHRHPQGDGLDRRLGRREALRRAVRHLHDAFGDRRLGHQQRLRAGAVERRARAGRHDHPCRTLGHVVADQARHRPHHVRRDDALRAGRDQAAGRSLRLPGVPRHRHRRPVDGEAGRVRAFWPA